MTYRLPILLSVSMYLMAAAAVLDAQTFAYIPSSGDGNVTRISTNDEVITAEAFGDDPYGAAVTPQGDYLVVTRPAADSITLVRTANFTTASAQVNRSVGDEPRGVAIESQGLYAYVSNYASGTVSEIYIPSFTVTDTITVGNGPWGVAATYDEVDGTPRVYVANHLDDSVSVITDDGVETIPSVGDGPAGLALTPDGAYLYAALLNADAVAVIRTSDHTVVATIGTGGGPWGAAVGSDGAFVYVTNSLDDTVTVLDAETQTLLDTLDVGVQPMGVACPSNGDFAYVVNRGGDSISRIDINTLLVTELGAARISGAYAMGAFIGGTPPTAPSGLSAVENGDNSIDLSWTDNAGDELGFKIERRQDTEARFTQIAKVGSNVTTFSDSGLLGNTAYSYRVRAYNEAADSTYATSAGATTADEKFSWCFIQTLLH